MGLCVLAVNAWGAQLLIPVDEHGTPIETTPVGEAEPEPGGSPDAAVDGESDGERLLREEAEARFAQERTEASLAYGSCLKTEHDRWIGGSYNACNPLRDELARYSPEDLYPAVLGCIEESVLGAPLSSAEGCEMFGAPDAADASLGVRWP
jgi:hypothetical protein